MEGDGGFEGEVRVVGGGVDGAVAVGGEGSSGGVGGPVAVGGDGGGGGFDGAVGVDSFARCSGPMNVTRPLQSAIMCVVDRAGVER